MHIFTLHHIYFGFVLQALVPITEDVEVSYELHRYIIGQKGSGIRKMMEEYEVCLLVAKRLFTPSVERSASVKKC